MTTLLASCLALLLSAPAVADVTIGYASSSNGYRGFGAYEGHGERSISGLKSRDEGNARFTGAVLGLLTSKKGKDSVEIVRVDLDKRWELDPKKKAYTESPITPPPPQEKEQREEKPKSGKEEKPTHRIKSAKADVKATGESKTINGFKASRHVASLVIEVENLETKDVAEYKMNSDIWATPWTKSLRDASSEEAKFAQAYAKKLGLELSPADRARFGLETAKMMLAAAGPEVEKAMTKLGSGLSKIDGYMVLTDTKWYTVAKPAKGKPAAKAKKDDEDGSALADAASAGSIGGAAAGFLGGLASRAAKKKVDEKVSESMDDSKPAFAVRTEVTKVETAKVDADAFEVPKDYKKKS